MKFTIFFKEPPGSANQTAGTAGETEPHEPELLFQNRNRTEPLHTCFLLNPRLGPEPTKPIPFTQGINLEL